MQENDNKPTECQPVSFSSLTEFELAFRELKIEFDMKRVWTLVFAINFDSSFNV